MHTSKRQNLGLPATVPMVEGGFGVSPVTDKPSPPTLAEKRHGIGARTNDLMEYCADDDMACRQINTPKGSFAV